MFSSSYRLIGRASSARPLLIAGAITAVALSAGAATASADAIPGRYIVTVEQASDPRAVAIAADGEPPTRVYREALHGFASALNRSEVAALQADPRVRAVEPDRTVTASTTQTLTGGEPWGLDRIDQRALPLSGSYSFNREGAGITAYVIDTGIDTTHPEFEGRAANSYDAFGGDGSDCDGHGTHIAGTVGARTYGVAKRVTLRGVRVLDCDGSGTVSGVIAGIDWVRRNNNGRAVANLSLGGGASDALDAAINSLVAANVFVSVAAGNDDVDACTQSPARAARAFTTAASARDDARAWFSNWGSCVDGYAPGVDVLSSVPGGGTDLFSGTSMAGPHVAGVAALLLSYAVYGSFSPASVTNALELLAAKGAIKGDPHGTPNRLLSKSML